MSIVKSFPVSLTAVPLLRRCSLPDDTIRLKRRKIICSFSHLTVTTSPTPYAPDETTTVLRIGEKLCHQTIAMSRFFTEHFLTNLVKHIVKTVRNRRD